MNGAANNGLASALLHHRLGIGDVAALLSVAESEIHSPLATLRGYKISCPTGAVPMPISYEDRIGTAPITSATTSNDSNPHSLTPPPALCQIARGFLPQGLSDAYRRPC